jgi:pimeloyl-ACP methyl ester carboxylesterase
MGDRRFLRAWVGLAATWTAIAAGFALGVETRVEVTLDDGRTLLGAVNEVSGVADDPNSASSRAKQIVVIHNGLSRTYVPQTRLVPPVRPLEIDISGIRIPQRVDSDGPRILLGAVRGITPFDSFGRRTYSVQYNGDVVHIVQGITEITPYFTVVEALEQRADTGRDLQWEMRMATSSIPPDTLREIFATYLDFSKIDDRLSLVGLYTRAERFEDARRELDAIIQEHQGHPDLLENLAAELRALRQLSARQVLRELQLRRAAGQYDLVHRMLSNFPTDDVAGETLQQVSGMLAELDQDRATAAKWMASLDELVGQLNDAGAAQRAKPLVDEIRAELNAHESTLLPRLTAFGRLADDESLRPDHRVSIALSGWLLGSNNAMENLAVSLSLFQVRDLVREYLRETSALGREQILTQLRSLEGANPKQVSQLLALMTPPWDAPQSAQVRDRPGMFLLSPPASNGAVKYHVQLPPEYDPHKRYPTVVTLCGVGTTPELQIDWWAGAAGENGRLGQATRRGYIVLAVDWRTSDLPRYGYTAAEHFAVLASLRDATRRFSIDTDRIYLSGHDIGGEAAWDIGLAHPDLWAGVILISATGDKYITRYWRNAQYVPTYFVLGQLDGTAITDNAVHFDRYLTGSREGLPTGFDTTVVEYIGRGHEHFSDDVQNIFDWMDKRRRDFFPKQWATATMRTGDDFFWWVELSALPGDFVVDPVDWPPKKRNFSPLSVEARISAAGDTIRIASGGAPVTIWLSPELVDFERRFTIQVEGRRDVRGAAELAPPDLAVMLEDVRTRADRQHPFWARLEVN